MYTYRQNFRWAAFGTTHWDLNVVQSFTESTTLKTDLYSLDLSVDWQPRPNLSIRPRLGAWQRTDAGEAIVQAVLRAVPGAVPGGSPTMSDMVFLAGIPSVKIGPGESDRSHVPGEYIRLEELQAGAAAYERIIREYFQSSTDGRTEAASTAGTTREGCEQ